MDDLWAILDNHQLLTTEHGRSLHVRRLSERAVMSELRTWLLQNYADAYCRSLAETPIFRRCYWIDGLGVDAKAARTAQAATKQNSEAEPRVKKSGAKVKLHPEHSVLQPIIGLSQALAQDSKPLALYGLILTSGSSKRKETRGQHDGQVKKLPAFPKESGLIHASWLEAAPTIINELAQSPAIFLLNPLGATPFTYNDLALLYQRTVPTELFLLIPHKQVEALLHAAQHSETRASLLTEMVRSDRWKTLPTQEEKASLAVDGWLGLFVASMQRHFQFPVQTIPLLALTGPATIEHIPYTLIFATRRQDSLISMNDAVWNYRHRLTTQSWQGVLGEEWFTRQQQERSQTALQNLSQRILQQGRAQRTRRWPDLRQQILLANFGQFTKQDYDMLIQQLLLSREVRCEWRQHSDDSTRIPGSEDTLLWR